MAKQGIFQENEGKNADFYVIKHISHKHFVSLQREVTKRVYFIGNERMLIAHDSNRLRFS